MYICVCAHMCECTRVYVGVSTCVHYQYETYETEEVYVVEEPHVLPSWSFIFCSSSSSPQQQHLGSVSVSPAELKTQQYLCN